MSGANDARPRPRRRLNLIDYVVRVPLGLLSLAVLAIVALPAMIVMTALYYASRGIARVRAGRRSPRSEENRREERVA